MLIIGARTLLPPLHTHRNPRPTPPLNPRLQIRMVLNRLKKIPHLIPVRKHVMGEDRPTPTQVNAKGLLREVHAAEEVLEARVVAHANLQHRNSSPQGFRCSWK